MMTFQSKREQDDEDLSRLFFFSQQLDHPLYPLQQAAAERLNRIGLPSGREDAFKFVSLRSFNQKKLTAAPPSKVDQELLLSHTPPRYKGSTLVFVNGCFDESLSDLTALPSSLIAKSLDEAFQNYGTFLHNQWQRSLKDEKDPFALMNGAFHSKGLFIYVPPKCQLSQPLFVLSLIDTDDANTLILPRLHLFCGKESSTQLLFKQLPIKGEGSVSIASIEASLEDHSTLDIIQWRSNELNDAWSFDQLNATVKKGGKLSAVDISCGSRCQRWSAKVSLQGEEAEADLAGLGLLKGKRESHYNIHIEHAAPYCPSRQLFKNILLDTSRSSFEGKIYVQPSAQKTDAFQLNNNLLLSDNAIAYSMPNLEIFADDVKASHGSTAGYFDEEMLFYLQARGLSAATAQKVLASAFCRELLHKIKLPSVAEELAALIFKYVEEIKEGP